MSSGGYQQAGTGHGGLPGKQSGEYQGENQQGTGTGMPGMHGEHGASGHEGTGAGQGRATGGTNRQPGTVAGGKAGVTGQEGGNTIYADDDIVARQLREAAEKEKDPELRKKLWEEYRKYKEENR